MTARIFLNIIAACAAILLTSNQAFAQDPAFEDYLRKNKALEDFVAQRVRAAGRQAPGELTDVKSLLRKAPTGKAVDGKVSACKSSASKVQKACADSKSSLMAAAANGDVAAIERQLAAGAEINAIG